MRLSADNGDYGWDVWLDGVLQKYVVMADDETGEVVRYNPDDFFGQTETVCGRVEIQRALPKGTPKPAGAEGLVAPSWSDSGAVPVGEVTEGPVNFCAGPLWDTYEVSYDDIVRLALHFDAKPSDPNAKPSLPSLSRVSGEDYRGLGWCDEGGAA
jgi:hypothetical protein